MNYLQNNFEQYCRRQKRCSIVIIYVFVFIVVEILTMQNLLLGQAPIKKAENRTDSIYSKVWNENREVRIFLPLEYFDNRDSLPVVYVMDGQSPEMFSYCTGLIDYLIAANLIRPMIVVGVSSYDRVYELTPTANGPKSGYSPDQKFGGAEKTAAYISDELIPYISKNYRTTEQRLIVGHSLGATTATTIFLKKNQFNGFILASPNYQFDNAWIIQKLKETLLKEKKINKFLYIGYGLNDNTEKKFAPAIRQFKEVLDKYKPKHLIYRISQINNQLHATTPLEVFPAALIEYEKIMKLEEKKFIAFYKANKNNVLIDIQKYYKEKTKWAGFNVIPSADELNSWGYYCLEKEDNQNAIKIFDWAISLYPDNYNLYDSKGEALMANDLTQAIEYFKKAITILDKCKNDMSVEDYKYYQSVFNDHLKKAESEKPDKSRNKH